MRVHVADLCGCDRCRHQLQCNDEDCNHDDNNRMETSGATMGRVRSPVVGDGAVASTGASETDAATSVVQCTHSLTRPTSATTRTRWEGKEREGDGGRTVVKSDRSGIPLQWPQAQ